VITEEGATWSFGKKTRCNQKSDFLGYIYHSWWHGVPIFPYFPGDFATFQFFKAADQSTSVILSPSDAAV
jgi:hypothetical protein